MFTERTSVGFNGHARSVAAAAIDGVMGELVQAKLTSSHEHVRSWLADLSGPVAVAYEAGPTGFGLSRSLNAAWIRCEVVAPSRLQRPSGDRVTTDAPDAIYLARLLRLDEFHARVGPHDRPGERPDLVRAREDCRGDLMRAPHRLSKLLLRQGIVYSGGRAWTGAHNTWLRRVTASHEAGPRSLPICPGACDRPGVPLRVNPHFFHKFPTRVDAGLGHDAFCGRRHGGVARVFACVTRVGGSNAIRRFPFCSPCGRSRRQES